jgi:hypothetical protein
MSESHHYILGRKQLTSRWLQQTSKQKSNPSPTAPRTTPPNLPVMWHQPSFSAARFNFLLLSHFHCVGITMALQSCSLLNQNKVCLVSLWKNIWAIPYWCPGTPDLFSNARQMSSTEWLLGASACLSLTPFSPFPCFFPVTHWSLWAPWLALRFTTAVLQEPPHSSFPIAWPPMGC